MTCHCHDDEDPWDRAGGHLAAIENEADGLRDDHRLMSPAQVDEVHRLANLIGGLFESAHERYLFRTEVP